MAYGFRVNQLTTGRLLIDENNPVLSLVRKGSSTGIRVVEVTYDFGYRHRINITTGQDLFLQFTAGNTWAFVYSRTATQALVYSETATIQYAVVDYCYNAPVTDPNAMGIFVRDASQRLMFDSRRTPVFLSDVFLSQRQPSVTPPAISWSNNGNYICQNCLDLTEGNYANIYCIQRLSNTQVALRNVAFQDLLDPFAGYPNWVNPPAGFIPTQTALLAQIN